MGHRNQAEGSQDRIHFERVSTTEQLTLVIDKLHVHLQNKINEYGVTKFERSSYL